jgi:hypothetical protein
MRDDIARQAAIRALEIAKAAKAQRGEKGEKGDKGDVGDLGGLGPKGEKGDKGDKGEKGDAGEVKVINLPIPGPVGPEGQRGLQGEKGPKGDKGDRGEKGDSGRDGSPGLPGIIGERGFTGPIGPMPKHEKKGLMIRFESEPGVWGKWITLPTSGGGGGRDDKLTDRQAELVALAEFYKTRTTNSGKVIGTDGTSLVWQDAGSGGGGISSVTSVDGSVAVTTVSGVVDLSVAVAASTTNVICQVRNTTGATLTKGTAVYISGATGQIPTVSKAQADIDATSAQTLGLMTADLANNSNGYVTVIGLITNINTSAYTDGQQLYLSPTVAGGLTTTKPFGGDHLVYIAVVEHAHPTQGKLFVKVQNGYEVDELHNVSAQSPSNGQTLVYNSSTLLWEKNTVSLTNGVNGTLPVANGGTGATTSAGALSNLGAYAASNPAGYTSNAGTVTSVSMTTPTGLSVTGSPITSSGTLALSMTAGYAIPTTSSQTNWDSAYTQRLQWDGGSTNLVASTGRTSLGVTATGSDTTYAYRANNLSDLANTTTARSNLGLGSAATLTAGSANGVATLDSGGKIPSAQLPAIAITDTFVVVSQSAMLALTAETGDVAVRTDLNKSFILTASPASTLANWQELLTPTDAVTSVAGRTGAVTLSTSDISGLGTIATQAANNVNITGGSITGITDLAVADGGTGSSTASGARTNLGLVIGTDVLAPNGSAASLTSFPTLNQNTTGTASNVTGTVAVANGGTGATTAAGARTNLGLVIGTDVLSPTGSAASLTSFPTFNQNTTGTASNVTGTVAIANGGTGATTRQAAMDALAGAVTSGQYLRGDGTDVVMSSIQAADVPTLNQNTTGTASNVTGTVAVANGGTGATTASGARTNLGLVIGTDVLAPNGSAASLTSFPTFNQNTTGTASNVTGTVAIANGGTGQTTAVAAFDALSPATTKGDLIVSNGTDNVRLAVGTDAYVLTADSTQASGVKWAVASGGGGSALTVKDEGTTLSSAVTSIDFVGAGVVATNTGGAVTVTVAGGGGGTSSPIPKLQSWSIGGF